MSRLPILELVDVHAGYGRVEVLRGVSLRLPRGAVLALLGPNGAGKTTMLRVISGLIRPTAGDIHLGGVHISGASPDALARAGLCMVPQGRGVFPNLTVTENLRLAAVTGVRPDRVLAEAFERFPQLARCRRRLAGTLSGGEQQLLSVARALASDPALLLLDELSMGLAPLVVDELYQTIAEIAGSDVSILMAEQFGHSALRVADYAAVMSSGRIVATGEPAEIRDRLPHGYLGGAA